MFIFDNLGDSLAPIPAGGYGPSGLNDSLFRQGISQPFEVDLIPVTLAGGVDYSISVFGQSTFGGSLPNPYLAIFDGNGQFLREIDDSVLFGADPFTNFRAPITGTYFFGITDLNGGTGDYTLVFDVPVAVGISPPPPGATF
ncbi:MAG: hypothetical protein F6K36_22880 [Symploca sp. SIO3C6]|nr:hypothetical protein [Symploca sp. SIO3C6]NET08371.1 hypothetical protein [Symploca sp. SIO2B6]NET47335.1 hypothetical protein [Merismopedia sp. SIO2A8]